MTTAVCHGGRGDETDFVLIKGGTATGNVSASTAVTDLAYAVTVSGVAGDGTLRLDLASDGSITTLVGDALADTVSFVGGNKDHLIAEIAVEIKRRERILVVDDKPTNRGIVLNLLEPLGFDVQEAENGQEALAKIAEPSPHLIIMDLIMPVMDGIEATSRIRQLPEGNDVTIIASSASVFQFNQQDSLKAGCNDFLNKPIRADELF